MVVLDGMKFVISGTILSVYRVSDFENSPLITKIQIFTIAKA